MLDFGFYNMDCMEGMKQFPDKYFDLAVVDPPYGINVGQSSMGAGGGVAPHRNRATANLRSRRREQDIHTIRRQKEPEIQGGGYRSEEANPSGNQIRVGGGLAISPKIYKAFDDSHIPDAAYFKELERVAKHRIIFGGNYFLDHLGATNCMIVWDKGRRGLNFADCEIAWTDFKKPARIFEFKWNGMLQEDMTDKEYRIHPTQKPVRLYEWIFKRYANEGDTILDTHVGSASSLIACRNTGHKYVGFEIDPDYYRMAKKRLDAAEAQMNLWDFGFNPYQE